MTTAATTAPTVLIIDDEMGILDTIRILLKSEGFIPYTALGGKKGLEQIAAIKPELRHIAHRPRSPFFPCPLKKLTLHTPRALSFDSPASRLE